jgi:hypothetical protein
MNGYQIVSEAISKPVASTSSVEGFVNLCKQQHNGHANYIEKSGNWGKVAVTIRYNPSGGLFFDIPVYTFPASKQNRVTGNKQHMLVSIAKGKAKGTNVELVSIFNSDTKRFGNAKVKIK